MLFFFSQLIKETQMCNLGHEKKLRPKELE
jgi:hypothetical protein